MQACNNEALFKLELLVLSSFVHRNTLYETVLDFRFEAAESKIISRKHRQAETIQLSRPLRR